MDDDERSPGGSTVIRHRARTGAPAGGERSRAAALVAAHFETHVGPVISVFHELGAEPDGDVHIDVQVIAPTDGVAHLTLFTSGMSDRAMTVPAGAEPLRFAELVLKLPATWQLDAESLREERWAWPVRMLTTLARLPHDYATWLGYGHTVPNGDPPAPLAAGTTLCCALLLPPLDLPDGAEVVPGPDGTEIHLYAVHFLQPDEVAYKLEAGTDALIDAFERADLGDVLDPMRASVLKDRGGPS